MLLALAPAAASAHARLISSDPPPGIVLDRDPAHLTLRFSEPVTAVGSGIEVLSPGGRRIQSGAARSAGNTLTTDIDSDEVGTFLVSWKVVSQDTHPSRGQFTFAVGAVGPAPASPSQGADIGSVSAPGLAIQTGSRWLHLAGVALALGPLLLLLLRLAPESGGLYRLVGAGILLLIASEPLALAGQAISLGSFDASSAGDVLGSSFGRVLGLRLGCALALWMVIGAVRANGPPRPVLLLPLLALGLVDGAAAHLIRGSEAAAILLNGVHELAMAVWLGGLAAALVLRVPPRRFRAVAMWSLGTLVVSGALLALLHLGRVSDLVFTAYGLVLAVKVVVVGAAILVAALGRRRLEVVALGAVVALAGLLLSLPPPA